MQGKPLISKQVRKANEQFIANSSVDQIRERFNLNHDQARHLKYRARISLGINNTKDTVNTFDSEWIKSNATMLINTPTAELVEMLSINQYRVNRLRWKARQLTKDQFVPHGKTPAEIQREYRIRKKSGLVSAKSGLRTTE